MDDEVAPRFDLATEVWIGRLDEGGTVSHRSVVLSAPSAEELCQLVLSEGAEVVVTGGIEEQYYEYLRWKRVEVMDSVMGTRERAVALLAEGRLEAGAVLFPRPEAFDTEG
jgi:predicted Fe-Mo cluster-binding NifX family protein